MVAAFLTTPFDVGKTRIQVTQHVPPPAADGPASVRAGYGGGARHVYKSMPSLLHGIWREEGARGLWRGCIPRMLKVAPACAIMVSYYPVLALQICLNGCLTLQKQISSYEVGKQWAEKHNQTKRELRE